MRECEKSFFCKTGGFGDSLATGTSRELQSPNNRIARLYFLSYSALVVVTLQLPTCFTCVALWWVISHESLMSSSHENAFDCTHTWILHILSHITLTWFPPKYKVSNCCIISKFGRNKANTWLNNSALQASKGKKFESIRLRF